MSEYKIPKFSAEIEGPKLVNLIEAIATICDEADFFVSNEGLSLRQMDPSRVAMITLMKNPGFFEEFKLETEGHFTVSVSEFLKLIKRGSDAKSKIEKVIEKIMKKQKSSQRFSLGDHVRETGVQNRL